VLPGVAVSPIGAVVPDVGVPDVGVPDVGVPDVEVLGGGEVGTMRSRVAGASADRGPLPAAFTAITLK
jgi:hypothetical protein